MQTGRSRAVSLLRLLLALLGSCTPALAADLVVAPEPTTIIVTPQRSQDVRFVATNLGPEDVHSVFVQSVPTVAASQLEITIAPQQSACAATVDIEGNQSRVTWPVGTLSAGAVVSCVLRFRALPTTTLQATNVGLRISAPDNSDPNFFNDIGRVFVQHSALDRPGDLSITAPATVDLRTATSATIELVLRNRGPVAPDGTVALADSYDVAPGPGFNFQGYDLGPAPSDPPCLFSRDGEGAAIFSVQVAPTLPIPIGGEARCRVTITKLPQAPPSGVITFRVVGIGPGVYDLTPADNVAPITVLLGFGASPVPLGWATIIGLAALIVVLTRNSLVPVPVRSRRSIRNRALGPGP